MLFPLIYHLTVEELRSIGFIISYSIRFSLQMLEESLISVILRLPFIK